jgi:short-subunit dehydrogenase
MPKPVSEQVVVITGASSGIGRETALLFGRQGASVVLAARDEDELDSVAREIERLGGEAHVVSTDVAQWEQVDQLARAAVERFGCIDTWVNNAAISAYATVEQMTVAEIERVIQVTLLGNIYGVKAALPHLQRQGQGTIINVASALAERSVPLQSAYCAAKHGIKGFTEALRLELAHQGSDVTVTLVLPSSINTPFFRHARSKMGVMPMPMAPVYEPRVVAEAILFAAQHPRRDIVVGGAGKLLTALQRISPAFVDRLMLLDGQAFKQQQTDRPDDDEDNFFQPMAGSSSTTGDFGENATATSPYTRYLELHPARLRVVLAVATLGGVALLRRWGRSREAAGI